MQGQAFTAVRVYLSAATVAQVYPSAVAQVYPSQTDVDRI